MSYYKNRLLGDKDQYIVIEHPKCGRTWLRYMIHQAESLKYNLPFINSMNEVYYDQYSLPRVNYIHGFKPGLTLNDYHHVISNNSPRKKGYIFLIRQPERVMISYYFQKKSREHDFEGSIKEFIRNPYFGITFFVEYVNFYMEHLKRVNHLVIKYEDLQNDTFKIFNTILDFVKLALPANSITEIIENSTFQKMKEIEMKNIFNIYWLKPGDKNDPSSFKIRSGSSDNIFDFFDEDDLQYMYSIYSKSHYFSKLGYTE